jgi:hypothetical protein
MSMHRHTLTTLQIHRAPGLTLWAAVGAECLGFAWEETLTLGQAVAGLHGTPKVRHWDSSHRHPRRSRHSTRRSAGRSRHTWICCTGPCP